MSRVIHGYRDIMSGGTRGAGRAVALGIPGAILGSAIVDALRSTCSARLSIVFVPWYFHCQEH